MAKVEVAVIGAGTVLQKRELDQTIATGARFRFSPRLTEKLGRAVAESGIAWAT